MAAPHPESSWYLTTATDKNSSQISRPKLQQGLAINEKIYNEILQYCASEINKASSGRLPASGPVRNGVKRTVFDLLDTKYGHVFKRSDLPSEFEAFALAAKKSIWRHVTTNRRGGVEVTMADVVQKRGALSSREQSVDSSRSRATSEAAQVLGGLSIKVPQQPNTTPTPFYEMSFAVYSYPDKRPLNGAPIPYGFALKTEHEHLLSDSPEKINAYHCGYDKLQAAMSVNFSADEYRDGWTIVDLTTGTPILNHMNLAFTVLSAKKAGLDIVMIGVKDPNRITKRTRFNESNPESDSDPDIARPVPTRRRTGTPALGRTSHEQSSPEFTPPIPEQSSPESTPPIPEQSNPKPTSTPKSTPPIPAGASSAVRPATIKTTRSWTRGSKDQPLLDELELLKGVDLDKVQTFETMPWEEMKGWCDKWPKSNREMFIDTLFEDMNNDPNLICIGEINLNRTWERRHFNASINPISTDKEPEDEHENEIEEVDQEVDHLKDVREAHINPVLWVKALQFLSFPLTVRNTLRDATFHLHGMKKDKAMWTYQLLGVTHALLNCASLGGTFLADTMGLGKTLQMLLIWYTGVLITKINLDWLDWKNQKGRDESLHLAPSTDKHPQPPNARCPSQMDGMPQCCCVEGSIARKFLNRPVGPTIYITRQNLLPQAVEDVESWFETSELNNCIPGGKLQVRVRHTAFIRSGTKKYDFTDEDKDILEPIKYEREGKVAWWKMDPRSASYLIITTSQTWATTWTAREQHKTIFNLHGDGGPRCIVSGILADEFHTDRLETGYLMKIVKQVYNDQAVFPRFLHPGQSYKDGNGKITYYTSRPSVVFTSGTPTSEGFTSLIPALEIFRAPNWTDFPSTKLINDRNIEALIKYEKLGAANRSSLSNKVITGFKECSSSIAKTLIMRRMGEDRWFDGRVINELPLVVYQDCHVTNDSIFKPYIEKLWRGASLDAFEQLNKAFEHWKAKGRKGEEPVFNMDQFLEGAGRLLKIFAIFPGLAKVGDEWQDAWWKDKTKVGTKPRWTVDEFRSEKWDEPSDENPLWKNWSTIANSGKLKRIIKYVDEVLKKDPNERLLFSSYEPAACTLLRLYFYRRLGQSKYSTVRQMESRTSPKDREDICEAFRIPIGGPYQNDVVQFLIINRRVGGEGLNLVSTHRVHLLEPATTVDAEVQVFGRAARSGQSAPVVTASTTYSMDKWNPIDMVMLTRRTMTEKMTIDKFHEVFETQPTQQADDDVMEIA